MKTTLKGKGKAKYLTDAPPKKKNSKFGKWDTKDSTIIAWLWASVTPEINDTCMFLSTTKEIWKTLKKTYSKINDAA